jgi:hypothetical protein
MSFPITHRLDAAEQEARSLICENLSLTLQVIEKSLMAWALRYVEISAGRVF